MIPVRVPGIAATPILRDAYLFAAAAHVGHLRKYVNRSYIEHPVAVARLLGRFGADEGLLAAAMLHDTIEDTPVTLEDVRARFGDDVGDLVAAVTDASKPSDGNRETRKALDRQRLSGASDRAKSLKLGDLLHNTLSIVRYDSRFAEIYLAEKALLLPVLASVNLPGLYDVATRSLDRSRRRLDLMRMRG